jgi:two-component system, OmpR family, phosphate regulon sensor histidine kinase PhoR
MSSRDGASSRQQRLSVLNAVQQELANPSDVDQLFAVLQRELAKVMDATGLLLGHFDEVSQMVEIIGQMEAGKPLPGGSFPLGEGFLSKVIRTRQPRHIRHWSVEGPRVQVQYATGTPGLPESTVTVPLLLGERTTGVLSVQSYDPDAYDEDDLLLVQALAAQIAPAVENLRRGQVVRAVRRVSELEAVLASMTEGLMILDAHGQIVSLNGPARAIFGDVGAGIVLGQPLDREQRGQWPLGARAIGEALGPVLEALRRGESHRDLEVELHNQGRQVLSFSSAPLRDSTGQLAGGVVVFRDVTTQRDVARMKDDLLSITSHDLRTPVTVLKGQTQLLLRAIQQDKATPATMTGRIHLMLEQVDRLTGMLNRLLDLSRVEAGRLDLQLESSDLIEVLHHVISTIQGLSAVHILELDAPVTLRGHWDAARLEQVVQNLVTNAIKYSPEGGRVTVRAVADARQVTVSVTDEGLGIDASELPQLFGRFYRVAGTRGLEGSGLGLYICQGIISAHGGRIWAESDGLGKGSAFVFCLPRRHPSVTRLSHK